MPEEPVTLVSLGGGALVEHFDIELERILKNIEDPSTDATAAREITLRVVFRPDQERHVSDVYIKASSKLASIRPSKTVVYMGRKGGKTIAVESNPKQAQMFDSPKPVAAAANVTPIRKEGE